MRRVGVVIAILALAAHWADAARFGAEDVQLAMPSSGQRKPRSVLGTDLRLLPSSFFARYDMNLTGRENALAAFRHFHRRAGLTEGPEEHFDASESLQDNADKAFKDEEAAVLPPDEVLTQAELKQFEDRAVEELAAEQKHENIRSIADPGQRDSVWSVEVSVALEDQKPAATQSLAAKVNAASLGWEAEVSPAVESMSMLDARIISGVRLEDGMKPVDEASLVQSAGKRAGPKDGRKTAIWGWSDEAQAKAERISRNSSTPRTNGHTVRMSSATCGIRASAAAAGQTPPHMFSKAGFASIRTACLQDQLPGSAAFT